MAVWVKENKKGSGIWYLFIQQNQKRKKIRIGNRKLAEQVAEQTRAELLLGKLGIVEDSAKPFRDYADIWKATVLPATCKASTQTDYKSILTNHVLPVFASRPVDKIKKMEIKTFLLGKINDGYAQSTVTHIKNVLGGILNLAVDDEAISGNPAHRLGKIFNSNSQSKTIIQPLTKKELAHLLDVFRKSYPDNYHLVLILARTGLRIGEALALKWTDIDFDNRRIHISRNLVRGQIETPKSGKGRPIDMSNQVVVEFQDLLVARKKQTIKRGWGKVPEWVFLSPTGKMANKDNFRRRVWDPALAKEENHLRKVRIHDLRHTYATHLLQAGWPMIYVKNMLGHHSIKVTVDIYGHLLPEENKHAANSLDDPGFDRKTQ